MICTHSPSGEPLKGSVIKVTANVRKSKLNYQILTKLFGVPPEEFFNNKILLQWNKKLTHHRQLHLQ